MAAANGTHHRAGNRKDSFSSFPPARSPSHTSLQDGMSRFHLEGRYARRGSSGSEQTEQTASAYEDGQQNARRPRRLKSQYPLDSPDRHVEYILVAEFDVDRGPTMEHQYPGAISGDEGMLAELMLPDQTHLRSQDWTMFFLHKDNSYEEEREAREDVKVERRQRREEREQRRLEREEKTANGEEVPEEEESEDDYTDDGEDAEDEDEGGEGPPLIYVLNLVYTKKDSTRLRGAHVRSMAICTRHPFLHIYKPLLLLALEEYFRSPVAATLENLYDAVNSMDLSPMPRLSILERLILQGSEAKELFIEKFEQMIQQRMMEDAATDDENTESPSRGDVSRRYGLPRDTHEYESRVVYNSIPIPIKVPTAVTPETVGDFSVIKLITTFSGPHQTQPQPFALHPHLTTSGGSTHPIIVLVNAILTQKRIIFLGHNLPSGEVAEAVLASCALVSGSILRGFTRHAFPYTDLSKIDSLLNVPGFIAGVTNPAFANHPEWWDILCDLPSGRIKISNKIEPAAPTDGLLAFQQQHPAFAPSSTGVLPGSSANSSDPKVADPSGDNAFMDETLRCIAARYGESAIRGKWRDYVSRFTRIAAAFEEAVYGASALYIGAAEVDAGAHGVSGHGYVWPDETSRARELGANVWRIEGWRNTRSYYAFIQDLAALWGRKPIRSLDLAHQMDKLRMLKLSREDSGRIYLALEEAAVEYDEVCQLLTVTPENHGGLFHLGLGLFHPDKSVREAVCILLERIRTHEAGKHFWNGLGRFAKSAFTRLSVEMGGNVDEELENGVR